MKATVSFVFVWVVIGGISAELIYFGHWVFGGLLSLALLSATKIGKPESRA